MGITLRRDKLTEIEKRNTRVLFPIWSLVEILGDIKTKKRKNKEPIRTDIKDKLLNIADVVALFPFAVYSATLLTIATPKTVAGIPKIDEREIRALKVP